VPVPEFQTPCRLVCNPAHFADTGSQQNRLPSADSLSGLCSSLGQRVPNARTARPSFAEGIMDIIMGIERDTVVIRRESITARAICQENDAQGVQANVAEIPMCFPRPAHKTGSPGRTASLHLANRTGTEHPALPGAGQRHVAARFLHLLLAPFQFGCGQKM